MIQQIFVETNFLLQQVFVAKFVCCNKFLLQQIFVETNFLLKKLSVSKPQLNLNTTPKQPNSTKVWFDMIIGLHHHHRHHPTNPTPPTTETLHSALEQCRPTLG